MEGEDTRFTHVVEQRLNELIKREFAAPVLDPPTLVRIRDRFRDTVRSACVATGNAMSDPAMHWIANQVFRRVQLGNGELLESKVIINEFSLESMSQADVERMHRLLQGTPMEADLRVELDRRRS